MRYRIEHLTEYVYAHAAVSAQQTLRLSPAVKEMKVALTVSRLETAGEGTRSTRAEEVAA